MARRLFVEEHHPRWPRGTGDHAGEFRDKTPDWADRISTSLPIAGGGSVPTGKEAECPVCGRRLKVVGNGKLSTHNRARRDGGGRCPGSGQTVAPGDARPEYTTRIPRRRADRTPDTARPPARPPWPSGRPTDPVGQADLAAYTRMARWRNQTSSISGSSSATHRAKQYKLEAQLARLERDIEAAEKSQNRSWYDEDQHDRWLNKRDALQRERDVEQQLADQMGRFDPTNPLAYYGDMLQVEDASIHSYMALDALEQGYPPALHKIAAEYLANTRDGGIWIGAKQIPNLDDMRRRLAGSKPGGDWRGDARGWAGPDGVVSHGRYVAIGYSQNTEYHRETRRRLYGRPDVDASAASHEFGHLLDAAVGYTGAGVAGSWRRQQNASEQRLFRLIHGKIRREAGTRLQPHFRQSGNAGPSEVWAEGLEIWGQGGTQQTSAPGYGHLTRREFAAIQKFHITAATAKQLMGYYDRLFKEIETGKRLSRLEERVV